MPSGDTELARALKTLSAGLHDGTELTSSFDQFASAIRAAVPSYCGLWMTVHTDGIPVTISAFDSGDAADLESGEAAAIESGDAAALESDAADLEGGDAAAEAASSLVIALSNINAESSGELVLFASVAGAFVDLAADLAFATSTELVSFEVDTRLGAKLAAPVGVGAFSVIHQAVGYLIAAGTVPEQAHARIAELAVRGGYDLAAAAERVVAGRAGNGR